MGLDDETVAQLKFIARETKTTVSQLCAKYVKQQLEYDEDAYYMKIIGERRNEPTMSLEELERRLNELQD
jgi:hypothetical protein